MSKSSKTNVGTIYSPAGIGGSPDRIAEVLARYRIPERAIEAARKTSRAAATRIRTRRNGS